MTIRNLLLSALGISTLTLIGCQTQPHHQGHHAHHQMMHTNDTQHVHTRAYKDGMQKMHDDMMQGMKANDPDVAFAKGMLPHHVGAIDMAEVQLKYGKDAEMRKLAKDITVAQNQEINQMQQWLLSHPDTKKQSFTDAMQKAYHKSMQPMHDDMMTGIKHPDPDMAFAKGMLPHHEGAVAMAKVQLHYGKDAEMRALARDIIKAQEQEIALMQRWINAHQ